MHILAFVILMLPSALAGAICYVATQSVIASAAAAVAAWALLAWLANDWS